LTLVVGEVMEQAGIDVRVLGPVELCYGGRQLRLTRRQQRSILGLLALQVGQVVTPERLIDLVWGERPPGQARAVLQTRVSEIRAALAALDIPAQLLELVSQGTGYQLRTAPEGIDANRFLRLVRDAHQLGPVPRAQELLQAALALWRGPILDVPGDGTPLAALCQPLVDARLSAVEDLLALELYAGNGYRVVDRAVADALAHPTRERLQALTLRALHATGRGTDALRHYDRWRRWLRVELGVDPAPDLQELHLALVRGDRELPPAADPFPVSAAPVTAAAPDGEELATAPPPVPNTLPRGIADFTGRAAEIDELRGQLARPTAGQAPLVAIVGRGGVGKTTLAVHVAHQLRADFPDGQLYVNLRGVDEDRPASAADTLGRFLRALGVDSAAIPESVEERTDRYRSLLADRRLLVVLDNAADDGQIGPLIPGGPGCAVIVTSRSRLGATLGAATVPLDVLAEEQSYALLAGIVGADRVADEADPAAELCRQCGHLPLALRVVGARLAAKPHWSLAKLVALLDDERSRLDQFAHGPLDVRATIAVSHRDLSPDARALLRRLSALDQPEYPVWVAAAALDRGLVGAEAVCEELFDAQLLDIAGHDRTGQPRYRMHDLVRLFGRERAGAEESPGALAGALQRVAGAWLSLARYAAHRMDAGTLLRVHGTAPEWPVPAETARELVVDPVGWLDQELPGATAMIHQAAATGLTSVPWELTSALAKLFEMDRRLDQWRGLLDTGLATAEAAGDLVGAAAMRHDLAILAIDFGDHDAAREYYLAAVAGFEAAGHRDGLAVCLMNLGNLERHCHDEPAALACFDRALPMLAEVGNSRATAAIMRALGQLALRRGDLAGADGYLARARRLYEEHDCPTGVAPVLLWQGRLRLAQERIPQARELCRAALALAVRIGDKTGQAMSLYALGLCHLREGDRAAARRVLLQALRLADHRGETWTEKLVREALAQAQEPVRAVPAQRAGLGALGSRPDPARISG